MGKIKDTLSNQKSLFYSYLLKNLATASMVSKATGIPQKNITRFKRQLEECNRLWEVEQKKCEETGFKAWYITTNEKLKPYDNQLNLFND